MDTIGARHLAARLQARVPVGTTIVLDEDADAGLVAGDRGIVDAITLDGVVVDWDRGFRLSIDPQSTRYHRLEPR
jgi:hypothetical protein